MTVDEVLGKFRQAWKNHNVVKKSATKMQKKFKKLYIEQHAIDMNIIPKATKKMVIKEQYRGSRGKFYPKLDKIWLLYHWSVL